MKPDVSWRLVRWSIELNKFDLKLYPRTTIRVQALVDFIIEQTEGEEMHT